MKTLPFLLILLFGLSACANYGQQRQTQAQKESDVLFSKKAEWIKASNSCFDKVNSNPDFKIITTEILVDSESSPTKMVLMTSNAKLSDKQKKVFLEYLPVVQKCRAIDNQYQSYFPEAVAVNRGYFSDMDIIYAKLIAREITIGQANRERASRIAKVQADFVTAESNIGKRLEAQHYQEVQAVSAQDAQRRAIAAQYLMNQQNINAQQQMNNRPVNTTCNRFGNQVNCTSQ
jgi:hypothetical protein